MVVPKPNPTKPRVTKSDQKLKSDQKPKVTKNQKLPKFGVGENSKGIGGHYMHVA